MPKHLFTLCLSTFLTVIASISCLGQLTPISVKIVGDKRLEKEFGINFNYETQDSVSAMESLKGIRSLAIEKGYLTASFDKTYWVKDTLFADFYTDKSYSWATLKPGDVPDEYLTKARFREKIYRNQPLNPLAVQKLFDRLVSQAENNGFPFAQISLDSIEIDSNSLSAILHLEKNQYTTIDSVIIKGSINTNRRYIENYIGFKKGRPFNQSQLKSIPNRLREIPFARVIKPYEIGMRPGKSDIYVYLDQRRASNFDGIIGIQPEDGTGKITFTGDVKLSLLNALKQGETIKLRWQRLQTNTQELNLRFAYPFILNTPIGVAAEFDLYRQDTLFSQIRSRLGFQYFFSGGNFVSVFYENAQSNVISNSITTINNYVDSRINMFGIGASITQLDYRFNPRRGYYIDANVAGGEKVIIENPNVDEADYDGINLESDIYNINLHAGYFIPFGRRSTLLLRTIGGYFINDNMFKNEMYRIGGLKTLRGFDEQSILASAYIIGTIEYRFILEENSNVFLFFDQGAYQDKSRQETIEDTPFGFGGGISFETKPGIFSLTYALGKQFNNPIEIRSGKIHFGFISFF
jgi:outer membrane protein assembly factor BamA